LSGRRKRFKRRENKERTAAGIRQKGMDDAAFLDLRLGSFETEGRGGERKSEVSGGLQRLASKAREGRKGWNQPEQYWKKGERGRRIGEDKARISILLLHPSNTSINRKDT